MIQIVRKTALASALVVSALFLITTTASAVVTMNHVASTSSTLAVGATFTVDVTVSWDGSGTLTGVFYSTTWDDSQLMFLDADWFGLGETASSLFDVFPPPVFIPGLGRLGALNFAGDPDGSARTVQYGIAPPGSASASGAANDVLVTTLRFEVIAVGDTTARVGPAALTADVGAAGDTFDMGSDVIINLPEPSTLMLSLSSLASVLGVAHLRRRRED